MGNCCQNKSCELEAMRKKEQTKILYFVLAINMVMFFVEIYYGISSKSSSLLSDSLDMLGDSLVYGFSIFVINKDIIWRAKASLLKAFIMLFFGLSVLAKIVYQVINPEVPVYQTMGSIGLLALIANLACFFVLYKYRNGEVNMKSTWLCSRNDIIANVGILLAAYLVSLTQKIYPDILIGLVITALFLSSSFSVLKMSFAEMKKVS